MNIGIYSCIMDKNRGNTVKGTLFAGLSFYYYDACSQREELLHRQNFIREIKQQGGNCYILYNAYRRSKYSIALCDPSCRTFVKSEAKDFVRKEKRDIFSIEFVRDSISSRELKNLNDYKLQFNQVCSGYEAMDLLQETKSFHQVQEMYKECDWAMVKCRGFKIEVLEDEDSDNVSAMSSYSESMSSLSEDEYESYAEDSRNPQRDNEFKYFKALYLDASLDPPKTSKPKPANLFKGITFYIHPPEKKYKQHDFLKLIKSRGGRIATETDLDKNNPIVCLTLCKKDDERVSEFVMEQHRDLFHYSFVNKSIEMEKLDDLQNFRTNVKYCSNYEPNILVDTVQKIKLFSFICKKHSRQCTTLTCEGIGKKCGYYRTLYRSRAPRSKYPCRIHLSDYEKIVSIPKKKVTFLDKSSSDASSKKTLKSAIKLNSKHNLSQPLQKVEKFEKVEELSKENSALYDEIMSTDISEEFLETPEVFIKELLKRNPRLEEVLG